MKEVSKSELKAKMFEYFRGIEAKRDPLVVTDFGKPVLIIYPYSEKGKTIDEVFSEFKNRKVTLDESSLLSSEVEEWND